MSAVARCGEPVEAALARALAAAVAQVAAGGLVAFPTETVWGLGADARSETALARLRRWKGRDAEQPVSVLVQGVHALAALGLAVPEAARRLAAAFWPGPLTLVLAPAGSADEPEGLAVDGSAAGFAAGIARADGAVGVRCSPHPVAAALAAALARAGVGPLTATSLNRHGAPPARTRAEARALCVDEGVVAVIEAGADAGGSAPSTVVDCTGARPVLLRRGAIDEAALAALLGPLDPGLGPLDQRRGPLDQRPGREGEAR